MKYKVGDVLHIEKFEYRPRPRPRPRPRSWARLHPHLHLRLHPHPRPRHRNTVGIITAVEKHTDIFESDSTKNDNGYIWLSQIDGKEYYFYENEVEGMALK